MEVNKIIQGNCLDVLKTFPDKSINCCVTSPPYYGLRDYGNNEQIGLEETPEKYIENLVQVFTEVKRVLKDDGTLWLNIGDSYAGSGRGANEDGKQGTNKGTIFNPETGGKTFGLKPKDLIGIPWMLAFALRSSGWYLRQDIIWSKKNCMPESVTDRCTKSHEYIFLLSKSAKYYYDNEAIKTKMECPEHDKRTRESRKRAPTKLVNGIRSGNDSVYEYANKRSVWETTLTPYADAHFATYPQTLITDCIKAGCPESGIVLDPFSGAGTTALVASKLNRNFIGIELNPEYIRITEKRLQKELGMFNTLNL